MNQIYNIGLVGALATISEAHLNAIEFNSRFKLKGVCDLNKSKLEEKFLKEDDVFITTNFDELVEYEHIDAIIVCTPHHIHAPISIVALNNGKHVLCEKPMTIGFINAEKLHAESIKSDAVFVVSYHFEYFPEVIHFRNMLSEFGEIVQFKFKSSEYLYPGSGWNHTKGTGGVWLDWAPNALSVLRKVISKDSHFDDFEIKNAKLGGNLGYEIDTSVNVGLSLNKIEGVLEIDWEAKEGELIAHTLLWNLKGDEIKLDHAANCIYLNNEKIWTGKDSRYRLVYDDFARRIDVKQSNILDGVFESRLIETVAHFE
ncbi:MAG: hypothetical protein BalsKO_06710 [Balneolaceae bacterium]